jgi:hypothetical protein
MLKQTNELCKELKNTYDSNVLKKYPISLQKLFIDTSKKKQTILSTLVNNLSKTKPNIKFITGPGECKKYIKDNKTIYIFGENDHSSKDGCFKYFNTRPNMTIEKYLEKLFETTSVFIDFYIELPVITEDLFTTEKYKDVTLMNMYDNLLYKCLGKNKKKCKWPVRIHTIDNRILVNHNKYEHLLLGDMYTQLAQEYYYRKKYNQKVIHLKLFSVKFHKEINELSKIKNQKQVTKYFWKKIINNELIQKEIKKSYLTTNQIKKIYLSHIKMDLKLDVDIPDNFDFENVGKWFSLLSTSNDFEHFKIMNIIANIIKVFLSPLIDIYTLTRIFRTFKVKNDEQYPTEVNNIIIYAGDGHTGPIGETLLSLGFKMTESSTKVRTVKSCTNMSGIKQPLFI